MAQNTLMHGHLHCLSNTVVLIKLVRNCIHLQRNNVAIQTKKQKRLEQRSDLLFSDKEADHKYEIARMHLSPRYCTW